MSAGNDERRPRQDGASSSYLIDLAKRNAAARRAETRRALAWHAEQALAKGNAEEARLALWLREDV